VVRDPAIDFIEESLASESFQLGCRERRWRVERFEYPVLDFYISAIDEDGTPTEYGFRADLTNFPSIAPAVRLWNLAEDRPPLQQERPKGGPRVTQTFKHWGTGTVYRPWDRETGPHGDNATSKPQLAWRSDRDLTFIFEDLHGILVSNGRKNAARSAA
jgi:hypothetical protein